MLAMLGNAIEFLEVLQFGILAVPQFAQARRAKNFTSEVIGMLVRYLLLAGLLLPAAAVVSSAQTDSVPMKVRHIHIRVTDVERTKAFYRDKLGFKVVNERPGQMVEFEGGQLWFGKWEGPGPLPTQAIVIGIEPKSVEATYNMLKQRGVDIPNPPQQRRDEWSLMVKDPDGYMIEIEGPK